MSNRGWKKFERRTARDHGVERTPVSGRQQDKGGLDWETAMFCAQTKLGQREPAYLRTWLDGIVQHAIARGKVGIVIWKPQRVRDDNALVILRYRDWLDLHGAPRTVEETTPEVSGGGVIDLIAALRESLKGE